MRHEEENAPRSVRVLLAHSDELYRAGCRHVLTTAPEASGLRLCEADRAERAYQEVVENAPEVCLLDYRIPPIGAFEVMRRMLLRAPRMAIVVVGGAVDGETALRLLECGAHACIGRECDAGVMLRAVLEAAGGRRYLTHDLAQQVAMLRIRPRRDNLSVLSPREYEVFRLVSTGLAQADIARALSLSTRSVANYTSLVKRKLNVSTTAELVHLAVRNRIIEIPG